MSRELFAFNLFMHCTVLHVNRRQGERRKIVVRYKSWTSKLWGRCLKGKHEEAVAIVSSTVPESQQKAILTVAFITGGAPPDLWLVHRGSDYWALNSKTVCVMATQRGYTQNVPKVCTSWMFNACCYIPVSPKVPRSYILTGCCTAAFSHLVSPCRAVN